VVNEPLSDAEAQDAANWQITTTDGAESLLVSSVGVTGTNLSFQTVFMRDPTKRYRIVVDPGGSGIPDRYGNFMAPGSFIDVATTFVFQQNVNGYVGTRDTELRGAAPDTAQGAAVGVTVDLDDGGGISHGLLRYEDLFGSSPGQVPLGAQVVSAVLTIQHTVANANGNPVNLHRMLIDWDPATVTYNSMVTGVQADGIEARTNVDVVIDSSTQVVPFTLSVDVTTTVRAWANGDPNHGWVFLPTGTDGYRWDTSESATPPALAISYTVPPCSPAIIQTQPATTMVSEGSPLTLSVVVSSPGCPARFQWVRNGTDILNATNPVYSVAAATSVNAGSYLVRVTNNAPSGVNSATVTVTVNLDSTRPVLTRAVSPTSTSVVLTFSKALDLASAQNTANYVFTPPVAVSGASLSNGANNGTVTLTTAARAYPGTYTLRISGVTDNRSLLNPINPNPTFVALTAVSPVEGYVTAPWLYSTNNEDGMNWAATGFVPGAEWHTGTAFFGFEDSAAVTNALPVQPNPIGTPLAPNSDAADPNRFVTAYFRRTVTLPALAANTTFAMCHWIDDGAIFYLDGVEINRYNMPTGPATFLTKATAANEASLQCFTFTASAGSHLLAVEVHQGGATTSSDMLFGAEIRAITLPPTIGISRLNGTNTVQFTSDSAWQLQSSPIVVGTYTAVAGNPIGSFVIPPAAQTNNQFFKLHYLGNP
jgi:hypothetical protein